MPLHPKQQDIVRSKARFKVARAGRRSGKTVEETETLCFKAVSSLESLGITRKLTHRKVIYIAPTQKQARTIIWESLKARLHGIGVANEQRLEMKVPNEDGGESTIFVGGWENRENYRGMSDVVHVTFDELDTMQEFFIAWQEIFRPMLLDTGGTASFIGTPKKENPNLRRLEKEAADKPDWQVFHFTSYDNPFIDKKEIDTARQEMDANTFRQEIMAEYVENEGSLFRYTSLIDLFTNTVTKDTTKFLTVDVADDGSDKTIFSFWKALEMYRVEIFEHLNTEGVIAQIRDFAAQEQIPYSHIAVDAIGVGAAVASSSMLNGIIGFKSSFSPLRTDKSIVSLPNVHYLKDAPLVSEYANLRSQCVFTLAQHVNSHNIAVSIPDVRVKEAIIEELALYQDISKGDGKRLATQKDDIKAVLGRSPDITDTLIMRMYFVLRGQLLPEGGPRAENTAQRRQFTQTRSSFNPRAI